MLNGANYHRLKVQTHKERTMVILKTKVRLLKEQLKKFPLIVYNKIISCYRQQPILFLFLVLLLFYIQFQ